MFTHRQGTPLGPALTGKDWLWSDGSYAGIAKTITEGVLQPKQYRSSMPPMGGAQLTPDQISALAAFTCGAWAIARRQIGINRLSFDKR
jgi:mono/diheme cytochrome c family protein